MKLKEIDMLQLKMTCKLYEDVKIVNEAISCLQAMVETLEKECMIRDGNKPATELFIRINSLKREINKIASDYEHILRRADIDHFGPLSEYVRPYLGFNTERV